MLNGRPIRVPDETRERVQAAAAELHFVPNALVRSLQAGRTGTLGVYVEFRASVWHNAFVGALIDGLRRGAADAGSDVLLYRPPAHGATADASGEEASDGARTNGAHAGTTPSVGPAIVMDGRADAAVLWLGPLAATAGNGGHAPLQALAGRRFPAVVLMHDAVPAALGSVVADERHGSALLFAHLRSLGHRTIAYYAAGAPQLAPHLRLRRDAFLAAAEAAGMPLPPQLVLAGPPAQTVEPLLAGIAGGPAAGLPTAIVCAFEELAYRTMAAAERAGLRVPDALSVAAWELGPPLQPPLLGAAGGTASAPSASPFTGVHVPIWEMGCAAAELALALARGTRRVERRLRFVPALQVAHSTGPAPDPPRRSGAPRGGRPRRS